MGLYMTIAQEKREVIICSAMGSKWLNADGFGVFCGFTVAATIQLG
jgi:hypothetical protein